MSKLPLLRDLASRRQPLSATPAASTSEAADVAEPRSNGKEPAGSYKAVVSKVSLESWRQLKHLAADLNRPVTELQVEALNLLFRAYGLPEICTRWTPGEARND